MSIMRLRRNYIIMVVFVLALVGVFDNQNVIKAEETDSKQEEEFDFHKATKEEKALAVLGAVDARDETTIGNEIPIVYDDGNEYGCELEYSVD